jgi:hypothetical protein
VARGSLLAACRAEALAEAGAPNAERRTPNAERRKEIMSEALKKTLDSWRETHGFGIHCILSPGREYFIVVPSDAPRTHHGVPAWPGLSELKLREHLAQTGLSETEIDEAVQLAREWATTITWKSEAASALWPSAKDD